MLSDLWVLYQDIALGPTGNTACPCVAQRVTSRDPSVTAAAEVVFLMPAAAAP